MALEIWAASCRPGNIALLQGGEPEPVLARVAAVLQRRLVILASRAHAETAAHDPTLGSPSREAPPHRSRINEAPPLPQPAPSGALHSTMSSAHTPPAMGEAGPRLETWTKLQGRLARVTMIDGGPARAPIDCGRHNLAVAHAAPETSPIEQLIADAVQQGRARAEDIARIERAALDRAHRVALTQARAEAQAEANVERAQQIEANRRAIASALAETRAAFALERTAVIRTAETGQARAIAAAIAQARVTHEREAAFATGQGIAAALSEARDTFAARMSDAIAAAAEEREAALAEAQAAFDARAAATAHAVTLDKAAAIAGALANAGAGFDAELRTATDAAAQALDVALARARGDFAATLAATHEAHAAEIEALAAAINARSAGAVAHALAESNAAARTRAAQDAEAAAQAQARRDAALDIAAARHQSGLDVTNLSGLKSLMTRAPDPSVAAKATSCLVRSVATAGAPAASRDPASVRATLASTAFDAVSHRRCAVQVAFAIAPTGLVTGVTVTKSSGDDAVDAAMRGAMSAVVYPPSPGFETAAFEALLLLY